MKLKVYDINGKASGRSVTLKKAVFETEPNDHAIWLDVRRIQANKRQGTHKTKERNEVSGSTRKLYRQKGTGNARAGSAKSPIRRSGGRTFGPRPRKYALKVNRKTQRLARRSAVAYKTKDKALRVIEDFTYEHPDTQEFLTLLEALDLTDKKVLLLTNGYQPEIHLSSRNTGYFNVREANAVSTLDVMNANVVLVQEGAVKALTEALS